MGGDGYNTHFDTAPGWPATRAEVEATVTPRLNDFMAKCSLEPADFERCLACYAYEVVQKREEAAKVKPVAFKPKPERNPNALDGVLVTVEELASLMVPVSSTLPWTEANQRAVKERAVAINQKWLALRAGALLSVDGEVLYQDEHAQEPHTHDVIERLSGADLHFRYPKVRGASDRPKAVYVVERSGDYDEHDELNSVWYDETTAEAKARELNQEVYAADIALWTTVAKNWAEAAGTMTDGEVAYYDLREIAREAVDPVDRMWAKSTWQSIPRADRPHVDYRRTVAEAKAIEGQTFDEWYASEKTTARMWRVGELTVDDA